VANKASRAPAAPKGAGVSGARLWREVLGGYELEEHELAVLREAVKTVDLCDKLGRLKKRNPAATTGLAR
jgi:hypothetical protein